MWTILFYQKIGNQVFSIRTLRLCIEGGRVTLNGDYLQKIQTLLYKTKTVIVIKISVSRTISLSTFIYSSLL